MKATHCFSFFETNKLRLNFVHCFMQKISLSVLNKIGDLPSANVITELRWLSKMQQVSDIVLSLALLIKRTGSPDEYLLEGLKNCISTLCSYTASFYF
jgi:hypothetical protein